MEILIVISLIVAGLLFFAVEVFLVPGISLAGIASAISMLYAIYYSFANLGIQGGVLTLVASVIGIVVVTWWFMRSKTVDKLSLNKSLDFKPNPLEGLDIKVGDQGTAITRLTLIGNAEFNGHLIEVQSADGFIDEKTSIVITRIKDNQVFVKAVN